MRKEIRAIAAHVVQQNGGWRGILGQLAVHAGMYALAETATELSDRIGQLAEQHARLATERDRLLAEVQAGRQAAADDMRRFVAEEIGRGWVDDVVLDRAVEIEQILRGDQEPVYGQRLRAAYRARNSGQAGVSVAEYLDRGEYAPDGGLFPVNGGRPVEEGKVHVSDPAELAEQLAAAPGSED